jgi:hypothetical protein
MASTPDVESAKVSRNVAIWVALITAAGGFTTALVTGSFGLLNKKSEPVVQRWIRINAVQLGTDPKLPPIDRVHLIAQVNGVSYAYPTSVSSLWAAVGPGMASEKYPLPIAAEGYRVKFYAFGSTPDGKFPRYEHKGIAEFELRQIPLRNATQGLQLSDSGPNGLATAMTIRYSIE